MGHTRTADHHINVRSGDHHYTKQQLFSSMEDARQARHLDATVSEDRYNLAGTFIGGHCSTSKLKRAAYGSPPSQ